MPDWNTDKWQTNVCVIANSRTRGSYLGSRFLVSLLATVVVALTSLNSSFSKFELRLLFSLEFVSGK